MSSKLKRNVESGIYIIMVTVYNYSSRMTSQVGNVNKKENPIKI